MQAKNLKIKVEEFLIIPVQIIHCFVIDIIHADIGKIYRISKSFILTKIYILTLSSKQLSKMFALFLSSFRPS